MGSLKDSALGSAIKNLDLTLSLEIPLPGPSDSSNSCPSISLGPVLIPLGTSPPVQPILPPSPNDLAAIGSSDSLPTIMGQETSTNG
jgi:hypothetical protein